MTSVKGSIHKGDAWNQIFSCAPLDTGETKGLVVESPQSDSDRVFSAQREETRAPAHAQHTRSVRARARRNHRFYHFQFQSNFIIYSHGHGSKQRAIWQQQRHEWIASNAAAMTAMSGCPNNRDDESDEICQLTERLKCKLNNVKTTPTGL